MGRTNKFFRSSYSDFERAELVREVGLYIYENKCTVRAAAKHFEMSKTTVHNWMRMQLPRVDSGLYSKVAKILSYNLMARAYRGGKASKCKSKKKKLDGLSPKVFEKAVSKVVKEYGISEVQAKCYIANGGRNKYICEQHNGECTCLTKCQEIYDKEQEK